MEYINKLLSNDDFYKFEKIRRLTLDFWPGQIESKDRIAAAGFYYNFKNDQLKCKFCEVIIGDWSLGDDPFVEHQIQSPHCPLINKRLTDNMPISQKNLKHELKLLNFNRHIRHPNFMNYADRIKTYENWPIALKQRPEDLSKAGFFYLNVGDQVKCFSCGGCLRNWNETDEPFNEHHNYFGQCKFVQQKCAEAEKSIRLIQNSLIVSRRRNYQNVQHIDSDSTLKRAKL